MHGLFRADFHRCKRRLAGHATPIFDTALLPATQPYGYSDATRQAQESVVGYGPSDQRRRFTSEQEAVLPYRQTGATK